MDICGEILDKVHKDDNQRNASIFGSVLCEFLSISDIDFNFVNCDGNLEKVLGLKDQYVYGSNYVSEFFDILKKHNYNMRQELKDAMRRLGNLEDQNKNSKLIKELLSSPVIDDISFDGKDEFSILSEQYGEFDFKLASEVFATNDKITHYIRANVLPRHCHNHAYFLSSVFDDYYAITALCRQYFGGEYYHSYTYDKKDNMIIDLCSNCIMDKESYYEMFEPHDISVVLNSEVEEELRLTNLKSNQPFYRLEVLRIALYKQYLDSIGYHGNLADAPFVKIKK